VDIVIADGSGGLLMSCQSSTAAVSFSVEPITVNSPSGSTPIVTLGPATISLTVTVIEATSH